MTAMQIVAAIGRTALLYENGIEGEEVGEEFDIMVFGKWTVIPGYCASGLHGGRITCLLD